jgi:hypothetical protein
MDTQEKKSFSHYMRVLHRDIGFFAIGLVIIYALSGIALVYRESSFFKVNRDVVKTVSPGLDTNAVSREFSTLAREQGGGGHEGGGRPQLSGGGEQGNRSQFNRGNEEGDSRPQLNDSQNSQGSGRPEVNNNVSAQEGAGRPEFNGGGRGRMRGARVIKEEGDIVYFDKGTYNKVTGELKMTVSEIVFPINKMIDLHKAGTRSISHWFIAAFAIVLIFLAVSSFWMFRKNHPNFKRGLLIAAAGIIFSVIMFFI